MPHADREYPGHDTDGASRAPAANSEILKSHSDLTEQRTGYHYELSTSPQSVNFSVTDGGSRSPRDRVGVRTRHKGNYIYERDGGFYESHLSFYKSLGALDLTTGQTPAIPPISNPPWAAGRRRRSATLFRLPHHASSVGGHFDTSASHPRRPVRILPRPRPNHVAAMKAEKIEAGRSAIFNPKNSIPRVRRFLRRMHAPGPTSSRRTKIAQRDERALSALSIEDSNAAQFAAAPAPCIACTTHEQLNQERRPTTQNASPATPASRPRKSVSEKCRRQSQQWKNCQWKNRSTNAAKNLPATKATASPALAGRSPQRHAKFFDHRIRVVRPDAPYPM